MNIIVSADKSIRLTQYSSQSTYNLSDIKFYFDKTLELDVPYIQLSKKGEPAFQINLMETTDVKNYRVFLADQAGFNSDEYLLAIVLNSSNSKDVLNVNVFSFEANTSGEPIDPSERDIYKYPYGLTDYQSAIPVIDREIKMSENTNLLLRGDNVSQCIRFKIKRFYDGIDLFDKEINILYLSRQEEGKLCRCEIKHNQVSLISENNISYMILNWAVPKAITYKAGFVSFAILIQDLGIDSGSEEEVKEKYVWQTLPASLSILDNIGEINEYIPIEEEEYFKTLENRVSSLESNVDEIKPFLNENAGDGYVLFDGGGSSSL